MQQPFARTDSNAFICKALCTIGQNSALHFILRIPSGLTCSKGHRRNVVQQCITCQEDSFLAAWGLAQNLLLLTGEYFAFSFPCAFLLGLYFPRARGGMWCCNHMSRGFVYSSLGVAKNLLLLTGEYFSFSFPAHSFRAYMFQWPEEECGAAMQPHVKRIRFWQPGGIHKTYSCLQGCTFHFPSPVHSFWGISATARGGKWCSQQPHVRRIHFLLP